MKTVKFNNKFKKQIVQKGTGYNFDYAYFKKYYKSYSYRKLSKRTKELKKELHLLDTQSYELCRKQLILRTKSKCKKNTFKALRKILKYYESLDLQIDEKSYYFFMHTEELKIVNKFITKRQS